MRLVPILLATLVAHVSALTVNIPAPRMTVVEGCKNSNDCCTKLYTPSFRTPLARLKSWKTKNEIEVPVESFRAEIIANRWDRALFSCQDTRRPWPPRELGSDGAWILQCDRDEMVKILEQKSVVPNAFPPEVKQAFCVDVAEEVEEEVKSGQTTCIQSSPARLGQQILLAGALPNIRSSSFLRSTTLRVTQLGSCRGGCKAGTTVEYTGGSALIEHIPVGEVYRVCSRSVPGMGNYWLQLSMASGF